MSQAFETLSRQDKATVISKAFNLGRNMVLSATVESMQEAWTSQKASALKDSSGRTLFPEDKPQTPAPEAPRPADDLATAIARAVEDKIKTGTDEATVRKIAQSVAEDTYKRLNQPTQVEVVLKTPDGILSKLPGKQHKISPQVVRAMNRRDNVWLAGPAGVGKTYLVGQIAEGLGLPFFRISCGPQTPASVVFGHTTASGGYAPGIAYQALTADGAVLLFDEFDRMNPAVAVMCNGLLDGNAVTFPNGETLKPKANTIYVVAANTFGKPSAEFGTAQRQDTSTMSRFCKILVDVDEDLETAVFGNNEWVQHVQKVRRIVKQLGITSMAVTPRASEYGVRALADGETRQVVEEMYLYAGVPEEDIRKIKANLR